jgi:hypothetical protein
MELVCGQMNNVTLDTVHQRCISQCSQVLVGVAYADGKNMGIFEDCKKLGIHLEFYGRHDYSVPVHPDLLKWFIDAASPDLTCSLVNEYFHPKVIWWVGAGAYIGSANLTPRAWDRNIEAGIFLSEDELTGNDMSSGLFGFFANLRLISTPLRRELWLDQLAQQEFLRKTMHEPEANARAQFEKRNRVPVPTFPWLASAKKTPFQRFEEDWDATIELLRTIARRVSRKDVKPDWILDDVPEFVQGDQFLHAFYYKNAREIKRVRELNERNKSDRERALCEAIEEWRQASAEERASEIEHMHKWAPLVANLCRKEKILTLSINELGTLLAHIHATRDHVSHGPLDFMPQQATGWTTEQRIASLATFLWDKTTECGWTVLQVLHYVVWGADGLDSEPITKRLWRAAHRDAQLPHLGIGTLGELVGWARSDRYPPRNGRTSKALLALGNPVNIKLD